MVATVWSSLIALSTVDRRLCGWGSRYLNTISGSAFISPSTRYLQAQKSSCKYLRTLKASIQQCPAVIYSRVMIRSVISKHKTETIKDKDKFVIIVSAKWNKTTYNIPSQSGDGFSHTVTSGWKQHNTHSFIHPLLQTSSKCSITRIRRLGANLHGQKVLRDRSPQLVPPLGP